MHIKSYPRSAKTFAIAITFLFCATSAFAFWGVKGAKTKAAALQEERNLGELQKQARAYRAQGFEAQRLGNMDLAISLYQKAIELDPSYAVPYNDLGVIFESENLFGRAEEYYLKSIKTDPNYLSAYTNLALFYESRRDLEKAALYWKKRADLGSPDDSWTQKARKRIEDIRMVSTDEPLKEQGEQEVFGLVQEVAAKKALLMTNDQALARQVFEKAKRKYRDGDKVTALKMAVDAAQIDPANREIAEFIERTQARILSK